LILPVNIWRSLLVYSNMAGSEIAPHASKLDIGVVDRMTRDERRKMLESFGRAPALLSALLRQLPKKMWLYKPSPERWSIHEIILHLADTEASSYVRCRHLIAEPGVAVAQFDPALWAGNLGYFHQSTREALEIIRRLRKMTYQLLVSVPEPVWWHTVEYPKEGVVSLECWIECQERHIPHHLDQMALNYAAWLGTHPPRKPATRSSGDNTPHRAISITAECC
jgi:hypothetical protein